MQQLLPAQSRQQRAATEQQMVDEAFVRLMVDASELDTSEIRAKVAWRGWKQLRQALGPKPRRGSDVRYAVAATEWADSTGKMTDEFLDHLHDIEEQNHELRAGDVAEQATAEQPGLIDRARNLVQSLTDIGEQEATQPTVTLGPPLELPEEEPPEGYMDLAYRKFNEAKDYVYDHTVGPVLENVADKADKVKDTAIMAAFFLGGLLLLARSRG